jgi:hypothetical protein
VVDEIPFPESSQLNTPLGRETIGLLASPMLGDTLHAVRRDVDLLAADIHRLSHNLHSSTVSRLGLVAERARTIGADLKRRSTLSGRTKVEIRVPTSTIRP